MDTDASRVGVIRVHWNTVAAQWRHFGPPLRPCAEDVAIFRELAAACGPRTPESPVPVLMLGVTPEIAAMAWPWPSRLTAIDRSPEMVQVVWPGDVPDRRRGLVREWLDPPGDEGRPAVVIGDGCFISTSYPDGHRALARHVRALLEPGGVFLMRFFLRPERRERVPEVLSDLAHGRIGSFHVFKWRLAMAVQETPREGVRLHDIWAAWQAARVDPSQLPQGPGWSADEIRTIDLYRDKEARFAFAGGREVEAILAEEFEIVAKRVPGYELGERCPILALRPRGGLA